MKCYNEISFYKYIRINIPDKEQDVELIDLFDKSYDTSSHNESNTDFATKTQYCSETGSGKRSEYEI